MVFDLKALRYLRCTKRLLSLSLALLLASSNVAFSAHFSSHSPTDSGLCSLCVHPGGTDTVTTHEPVEIFFTSTSLTLKPAQAPACSLPAILQIHQSRAPPSAA